MFEISPEAFGLSRSFLLDAVEEVVSTVFMSEYAYLVATTSPPAKYRRHLSRKEIFLGDFRTGACIYTRVIYLAVRNKVYLRTGCQSIS